MKQEGVRDATTRVWAVVVGLLGPGCYQGLDAGTRDAGASASDSVGDGDSATESDSDSGEPEDEEPVDEETLSMIGEVGMRRLTAAEYDATVRDLLGVQVSANLLLPEDWRQPFDNDYTTQVASGALIEGAELLAADVASLALETAESRDAVVGCTPTGPTDTACFNEFIARFGRRALRRPLTDEEVARFGGLIAEAEETGDFYLAVDVALRAFLMHPAFLYRIELGTPIPEDPGVFRLNDFEVATRLSYLIWGSTPSDELLDLAAEDGLGTSEEISAAAEEMLLDDRARDRVDRFHALWLGYELLPHTPDLTAAMKAETRALLDRVIFDDSLAWQDLLRAQDTYIDDTLAAHYGLPTPGGSAWVDYGDSGRRGLLSHGTFLSSYAKVGDSSPTKRGILVRTRLLCEVIPDPPDNVDVDNTEPPEGVCKEEFYRGVHAQGSCAGCHALMDPIGLGLENYDHTGAFRTVENDNPECVISGEGELDGQPFSGPAELSDLLLQSDKLNRCVVTQLYRFAMGRTELHDIDEAFLDHVTERVGGEGDFQFAEMMLGFVSTDAFRFRRLEGEE